MPVAGRPLLVTGVPRSGTTWLARLLASATGTAMTGREPMNPRHRQYALGGTLESWTRLQSPTARQRLLLQATYRGLNPRTYGRYGRHQLRALLPGTRVVVKDPFAMLSVPIISEVTGAQGIQLYRHPGAVLASYRRMGWRADMHEIQGFEEAAATSGDLVSGLLAGDPARLTDTEAMGVFWSVLTSIALDDLAESTTIMVAHHELAGGGEQSTRRLFEILDLRLSSQTLRELRQRDSNAGQPSDRLHRLDRNPTQVANAWKQHVPDSDVARIEEITEVVRARVETARIHLITS